MINEKALNEAMKHCVWNDVEPMDYRKFLERYLKAAKQQPSAPVAEDVERVAFSIGAYEWQHGLIEGVREDFSLYLAENRREYDEKAKAAIAAMPSNTALIRQLVDALETAESPSVIYSYEEHRENRNEIQQALSAGQAYLQQQEGK